MSDNTNENTNPTKAKTGKSVLREIEDKVFSGKLGAARKVIEDLVPSRDKAFDAYNAIQEQLDAAVAKYDEILKNKS